MDVIDHAGDLIRFQQAVLGRYSIEREIGRGGMGIVYLARDVALDRPVAIKLLPPLMAAEQHMRNRFLSEARTAARLSHPNIIPIFSVEEIDQFVFFAMAYVDGKTLGSVLRQQGTISPSETIRILREVAWALAYAHAQGVIHRDVKPDNILIENTTNRILVADFGIARVTKEQGLTGVGEILGTAEYMSPEQASGEGVDQRSDIYSLGVVGFYMLSGRLPFEGSTTREVLNKQLNEPPPLLSDVTTGVPSTLARAISSCLNKDRSERPDSAETFAEMMAGAVVVRTEVPVSVRVFLKRTEELMRNSRVVVALASFMSLPILSAALGEGASVLAVLTAIGIGAGTIAGALGAVTIWNCRQVLKMGYGYRDVDSALKEDLERHLEEARFEYGHQATGFELATRYAGVGLVALSTLLAAVVTGMATDPLLIKGVAGVAGAFGVVSGMLSFNRFAKRIQLSRRIRNGIFRSKLGSWLFRVARIGLGRTVVASGATHRPTELAIGIAVDSLLEGLPKHLRKDMSAVPGVIRALESDAQEIRSRIEELDGMLGQVGGAQGPAREIEQQLSHARTEAQQRLLETVTAMESIRLDLLRLQAGTGTSESVTRDMEAAMNLQEDINRLIESHEEVERLVKAHLTNPAINVEV